MKRIVLPTLLFTTVLFSKNISLKTSLMSSESFNHILIETSNNSYMVKKGDTLSLIAKKHNISLIALKRTNHISKDSMLLLGSTLQIPGAVSIKTNQNPYGVNKPFLKEAKKHLGKRYVWAANGPAKFDCSGFTKYVYNKNGITIPRTSIKQAEVGKKVSRSNLKAGDLIFFDTSKQRDGYVNHVGIYLGDNKFIHASSAKKKVMISSLSKNFYDNRFKWGRRVN